MYEVGIIGGGLGGLLLCRALEEQGISTERVLLIDARAEYRGSDNPGAMMHPFPGRKLAPREDMLRAYRASADLLESEVIGNPEVPSFRGPMVRPLIDEETTEAFESSWRDHRDAYPEWLTSACIGVEQLSTLGFSADTFDRAISYGPAYSVDLSGWMTHLAETLESRGLTIRHERVDAIERRPRSWRLHTPGDEYPVESCVLAVGARLGEWFPTLNIQPTGGALVVVDPGSRRLNAAISAGGHIAPVGERRWVAGATWWHDDEFERVDDASAARDVIERVSRLLPEIEDMPTHQVWRGVRAVHANDRRPLVGEVAGQMGLYVCGAFGSKGLLWTPLLTECLARSMTHREAIPGFADAGRLSRRWWAPSERIRL